MLQIKKISKSYTTGDFTQKALDDISVNFRKNEFVAILGPSGSGKTTFLNVIALLSTASQQRTFPIPNGILTGITVSALFFRAITLSLI